MYITYDYTYEVVQNKKVSLATEKAMCQYLSVVSAVDKSTVDELHVVITQHLLTEFNWYSKLHKCTHSSNHTMFSSSQLTSFNPLSELAGRANLVCFACVNIARSANLPVGLYILPSLIFFFFSFLARSAKLPEGLYILPMFFLCF